MLLRAIRGGMMIEAKQKAMTNIILSLSTGHRRYLYWEDRTKAVLGFNHVNLFLRTLFTTGESSMQVRHLNDAFFFVFCFVL